MNKQSLIAIFAVSLLLITASSALITNCAESDATTSVENDQTPEFRFKDYTKISNGPIDTYLMHETVKTEDLFGNAIPENCEEFVTVKVTLTLNNEIKTIGIDIKVTSGGEQILFFSDTISDDGIAEENAWIYQGMIPTIAPMGVVADVQNAWNLIQELQDLLPKVSSNIIKEKIEKMLAKAVVKKIALAAASAVIPGVGWAIAIISAGLAVYDILQLLDELPELVELAKIDIAGCIYDEQNHTLKLAERYGGTNTTVAIELENKTDPSKKDSSKFYVAYVDVTNHEVFVSNFAISEQHAIAIMSIPSTTKILDGDGLSVYTVKSENAKRIAEEAAGSSKISDSDKNLHHTTLHKNANNGLKHYHHALHNGDKYPAHSFYGTWL